MKFLCDNCKAKYQIADEKLEGRAVQMKCRKCGHVIDVPSPTAAKSGVGPRPLVPDSVGVQGATADESRPLGGAPRPGRSAGAVAAAKPAPVVSPPAGGAGLAGAFAKTVREKESTVSAAIEVLSAGAAEEWYVGVNGVPLGPVRLSVLRQKAAQGVITEDSLVWREGFDEWLPLRTFPELSVLVHEARENAARSLTPPPAPVQVLPPPPRVAPRSSLRAPMGAHPTPLAQPEAGAARAGAVGFLPPGVTVGVAAPIEVHTQAARAGTSPVGSPLIVGPGTVEPAIAEKIAGPPAGGADADIMPDPFSRPAVAVPEGPLAPMGRSSVIPESPSRLSVVDEFVTGVRKQQRLHPAAFAFIGLVGVLGGVVLTIVVLNRNTPIPPTPTVQIVTVTAPQAGSAGLAPKSAVIEMGENLIVGEPGNHVAGGAAGPRPEASKSDSKGSPGAAPTPLPGLDFGGPSGPVVAKAGGDNSNLPKLDQAEVSRVISANRAFASRGCWEPAMAAGGPNAPAQAKVSVSATVGADGKVQSVNASGGDGYPGLASCIAGRVRSWSFRPSSETTQINIPFTFIRQ